MGKSPEEQFAYVQAISIAHSLVWKALIPTLVPDPDSRRGLRDGICHAIEKLYEEPGLSPEKGHYALQVAMAEVESLFQA